MDKMLGEMTAEQFLEWQEFAREEPFGFPPLAELVSLVCAVVANAAPFRSGPPISPAKFRWEPGREKVEADPDVKEVFRSAPVGPDLSRPIPD